MVNNGCVEEEVRGWVGCDIEMTHPNTWIAVQVTTRAASEIADQMLCATALSISRNSFNGVPCSTRDVDAVVRADHGILLHTAVGVAAEEGWPMGGFCDGTERLFSESEQMGLMEAFDPGEDGGLRVHRPSPRYLLAMQFMSMRLSDLDGSSEASCIRALGESIGLIGPKSALQLIEGFYPGGRIPPETSAVVQSVFG